MIGAWSAEGRTSMARPLTLPGLLGRRAGLLPSRLLRLLLGLTGTGRERDGRERDSEDEYSRELMCSPFFFSWLVATLQRHGGEDEYALDDPLDLSGHVEQVRKEDQGRR